CDGGRRHPVCPGGLCGRGVAYCRSGAEGRHSGLRIRAKYVGARRGRPEGRTRRRLAQPDRFRTGATMKILADADVTPEGVNFSVFLKNATAVDLLNAATRFWQLQESYCCFLTAPRNAARS